MSNPMASETLSLTEGGEKTWSKTHVLELLATMLDLADQGNITTRTLAMGLAQVEKRTIDDALSDLVEIESLTTRLRIALRGELTRRGSAKPLQ